MKYLKNMNACKQRIVFILFYGNNLGMTLCRGITLAATTHLRLHQLLLFPFLFHHPYLIDIYYHGIFYQS